MGDSIRRIGKNWPSFDLDSIPGRVEMIRRQHLPSKRDAVERFLEEARITVVALVVGLLSCASAPAATPVESCPSEGVSIVVATEARQMMLCEAGVAVREYRVSLGRKGTGKTRQGDLKTPLGTYDLGQPRLSRRFGIFIPVGYPTEEQKRHGYSGSDIGIHGPDRRLRFAGRLNGWIDWTRGCIAVTTDSAMAEIADWVRQKEARQVHLR
ncbi:MAG: L,D-transpeptidase family protein [Pseudomonadota bacterium]